MAKLMLEDLSVNVENFSIFIKEVNQHGQYQKNNL